MANGNCNGKNDDDDGGGGVGWRVFFSTLTAGKWQRARAKTNIPTIITAIGVTVAATAITTLRKL